MLLTASERVFGLTLAVLVLAPLAHAQPGTKLSGAQLKEILANETPWAGVNHLDGCVFITTGPAKGRTQYRSCPDGINSTFKGSQVVEGDLMCITWPGSPRRCTEWYQIGENKFQQRASANADARNTIYLLK